MTPFRHPTLRMLVTLVLSLSPECVHSAQLINDREIKVHSTRQVSEKRRELINYLWGLEGFPKQRLPDAIVTNVPSPVKQLTNLARVDEILIELAPGLQGLA